MKDYTMSIEEKKQIYQLRQSISQNEEQAKRFVDQIQADHYDEQYKKIQEFLAVMDITLQEKWLHYVNNPTAINNNLTDIICLIPLGDNREVLIASIYGELRLHAGVSSEFSSGVSSEFSSGVYRWDDLKFTRPFDDSLYWVTEQLERKLTTCQLAVRQLVYEGIDPDEHLKTIMTTRPEIVVYSARDDVIATKVLTQLARAGYQYLGQSNQDGQTMWTFMRKPLTDGDDVTRRATRRH